MLCQNCGKNQANVTYTQIINGEKKVMHLCENCSEKLGINNMDFKMSINFSSFLGDFLEEFENSSLFPELNPIKELKCDSCNLTFEEFMNTGKFGCANCYSSVESKIDPILKNIHGSNRHVGRLGKIEETTNSIKQESQKDVKIEENAVKERKQENEIDKLKEELKNAIKEERYEDAAKLRDKIKKLEK